MTTKHWLLVAVVLWFPIGTWSLGLLMLLLAAASTSSQEKPMGRAPIETTTHGSLLFSAGPPIQTILTCSAADSDPESYYDCKIAPGHSLDEVMRVIARQMYSQSDSCQKDKELIFKGWQHTIDQFKKSIPHPIQQDKKGRS
jgi:hypothetical protein